MLMEDEEKSKNKITGLDMAKERIKWVKKMQRDWEKLVKV